jgi:hypothetical protein
MFEGWDSRNLSILDIAVLRPSFFSRNLVFGLKPLVDWMRPIHIFEDGFFYLKSSDGIPRWQLEGGNRSMLPKVNSWRDTGDAPGRKNHQEEAKLTPPHPQPAHSIPTPH